jgi:hypothetical protein
MRFIDLELARRVENAEATGCRECAEAFHVSHPEFPVAVEQIAGGVAVFAGVDSPVTQAIGVGINGAVADADLDRMGDFFAARNAPAAAEICPFVEMSLYERFAARGYRLLEVSNVLVREIAQADAASTSAPPGVTVRQALPAEAKLWTGTVAQGFAEHFPVTQEVLDVMEGFFHGASAKPFLAFVDGQVAGGGALTIHDGVCAACLAPARCPTFAAAAFRPSCSVRASRMQPAKAAISRSASRNPAASRIAISNAEDFAWPIREQNSFDRSRPKRK